MRVQAFIVVAAEPDRLRKPSERHGTECKPKQTGVPIMACGPARDLCRLRDDGCMTSMRIYACGLVPCHVLYLSK